MNSYRDLRGCLQALTDMDAVETEIVVIDRLGPHVREYVRRDFPHATVLAVPPDATIPAMRAIGFERASAPCVGVIEDHVIVPQDWGRRMLDVLGEGYDVVGGSVVNAATENLVDWASFLCEYSGALPPLPAGPSQGLPGNNIVYRKAVLDRYKDVIAEGKWENNLHGAMLRDGVTLMMQPDIVVGHKMHYTFQSYLSQRFLYSRSFAGARVREAPLSKRLVYGAAACALPPVLLYRTVQRIVSKKRHLGHLVKSLPMLSVFVVSWAAGEAVGYIMGAGNSLSKVR